MDRTLKMLKSYTTLCADEADLESPFPMTSSRSQSTPKLNSEIDVLCLSWKRDLVITSL
jgi:hypothetical protein